MFCFWTFLLVIWTCRPVHTSHLILRERFLLWLFGDSILNFSFLFQVLSWLEWILWVCWNTLCFRACHSNLKFSIRGKAAICLQANCLWFMQLKCCLRIHCSSQTSKFVWHTLFHKLHFSCIELNWNLLSPKMEGVAQLLRLFLTEHSLFLQLYKLSSSLCTSDVTKQT
jgi:hypothetical protein